ncbi:MAG: ABC transporter permease [Candidatus Manganitrophaceae bacterium]
MPLHYSLRNLWVRRVTTLLTAGGIALVIFVFAAVLMLAYGLEKALMTTGSEENAIVVRRGASTELMSLLDRETVNIVKSQPEVARDAEGKPVATSEGVAMIHLPKRGGERASLILLRGVSPDSLAIRSQLRLTEGRPFRPGMSEVIVGASIARRFQGIGLGDRLYFALREWTVVGLFEAEGSAFESEIWLDSEQMLQAFHRSVFSSVTVRLADRNGLSSLKARLESDPRFVVEVKRERAYYADQSGMTATFIRVLGIFVTLIFSIGAVLGAMITMYASVAHRILEIGTLRAIGFQRGSILLAFLIESLLLALIGGGAGLFLAAFLQAVTFSTINFSSFSELAFRFALSPAIMFQSMFFALAMGFLGGFLPAFRASRQKIVEALRGT